MASVQVCGLNGGSLDPDLCRDNKRDADRPATDRIKPGTIRVLKKDIRIIRHSLIFRTDPAHWQFTEHVKKGEVLEDEPYLAVAPWDTKRHQKKGGSLFFRLFSLFSLSSLIADLSAMAMRPIISV